MSEWMAIAQWHECEKLTRPGIVFELKNAEGLTMLSPCVAQVPAQAFRLEVAPGRVPRGRCARPRHSEPMPPPTGRAEPSSR